MREILKKAQERYGKKNQIAVTLEELAELSAVLPKYLRYPTHEEGVAAIREHVVEEVADVVICLEHVSMIFDITPEELLRVKMAKLGRLQRWLDTEEGFHQTTKDREWKK